MAALRATAHASIMSALSGAMAAVKAVGRLACLVTGVRATGSAGGLRIAHHRASRDESRCQYNGGKPFSPVHPNSFR
jgi:hypothetical protein